MLKPHSDMMVFLAIVRCKMDVPIVNITGMPGLAHISLLPDTKTGNRYPKTVLVSTDHGYKGS
jgi:hypothetical protein